MRPPQPSPQLRVSAVTLRLRGARALDVLVYPNLPLPELQRCVAAGFRLPQCATPIAVKDVKHVVFPLSLVSRSPEMFENGIYEVILDGVDEDEEDEEFEHDVVENRKMETSKRSRARHHRTRRHSAKREKESQPMCVQRSLHYGSEDDEDEEIDNQ
uniref:Uncharacterized protein n=1 Tax=Globisporangium ultimum (strain ATCC 200006 / CBS 805.95 / DAOM BR144) TaxID=431595 RepID=K3WY97_GLOUD